MCYFEYAYFDPINIFTFVPFIGIIYDETVKACAFQI